MTTLIFVRHGQSHSNLERRFTGQGNVQLTELGIVQAQKTAAYLADFPIDRIYASDLDRAVSTAIPTAKCHNLEIIKTKDYREIFAGDWEGKLYEELMREYPETYDRWLHDIGNAGPDGGERVAELAVRVWAKTEEILTRHRGECVAIFTHATPVRMMGCKWFGLDIRDAAKVPFCGNASVSVAEYEDDGSFHLIRYGYDGHQGNDATTFPKNLV